MAKIKKLGGQIGVADFGKSISEHEIIVCLTIWLQIEVKVGP